MHTVLRTDRPTPSHLRQIPVLANLPESKLQWIIDQGEAAKLKPGELLRREGEPADCVFFLLEGSLRLTQRVGNQDILLKQHDTPTLFGEVPLLMGVPLFWASGRAITACHILQLNAEAFWQFMGLCPALAMSIFQEMVGRIQEVQVLAQHRERLASLGTLAAGLAHELNNPASAARRAARELRQVFPILQTETLKLTQQPLDDRQREFLTQLQQDAIVAAQQASLLDPLTRSDREDALVNWMEQHNISRGWQFASALVNAGLDCTWLNQISEQLDGCCLPDVLTWLDATLTVVGLLNTLGHSTTRIHQLVEAVQNYSSWDAADLQLTDVHEGLKSTLLILEHQLKRGIIVIRDYTETLPLVLSHEHELEQVWMNIIDNAIDALTTRFNTSTSNNTAFNNSATANTQAPTTARSIVIPVGWQSSSNRFVQVAQQPTIWIKTRCEANQVLIEIADNGTGIPPEIQSRIFEPFFTTKGIGKGTGLGLNTSYKIIERHGGDIRVTSQPGETCFQIRLPAHNNA